MSEPKERENADSDDEFQDASAEPTPQNNETNIEELIQKQEDLKLPDDDSSEGEATEEVNPEMIDDIIDEDELRELEKDMSEADLLERKEKTDKMKLEGNELFKNGAAEEAINVYTEALKICPTTFPKERAILYGNRAAAKIKIDSKKSAICDCSKAIELWPEYVRAILRRAKLYELDDKFDEALADYKRVYELDAGHREAIEALSRLPQLINERNEHLKTEMFSKLKDLGNMILKPFGMSTDNFQVDQDPGTGSYSINFKQNSS